MRSEEKSLEKRVAKDAQIATHRDLEVWQRAYRLVLSRYRATQGFPQDEKFGLTSQIRRAVVSVVANIAEGSARGHRAEFVQGLSVARGSAVELETLLSLAKDLDYLDDGDAAALLQEANDIRRMLNGLISSLRRRTRGE